MTPLVCLRSYQTGRVGARKPHDVHPSPQVLRGGDPGLPVLPAVIPKYCRHVPPNVPMEQEGGQRSEGLLGERSQADCSQVGNESPIIEVPDRQGRAGADESGGCVAPVRQDKLDIDVHDRVRRQADYCQHARIVHVLPKGGRAARRGFSPHVRGNRRTHGRV